LIKAKSFSLDLDSESPSHCQVSPKSFNETQVWRTKDAPFPRRLQSPNEKKIYWPLIERPAASPIGAARITPRNRAAGRPAHSLLHLASQLISRGAASFDTGRDPGAPASGCNGRGQPKAMLRIFFRMLIGRPLPGRARAQKFSHAPFPIQHRR
jgi:hypothetical protein